MNVNLYETELHFVLVYFTLVGCMLFVMHHVYAGLDRSWSRGYHTSHG